MKQFAARSTDENERACNAGWWRHLRADVGTKFSFGLRWARLKSLRQKKSSRTESV